MRIRELIIASLVAAAAFAPSAALSGDGPDSADLIRRARDAAGADRHSEAAALFEEACALDSSLVPLLGKEIGYQLTWDDRPREALPYFEAYISSNPGDSEGLLGYALALSWADRNKESLEHYRDIKDRYPGSMEAMVGEARVVSWMDRNSEAERLYRAILDTEPGSLEARLGLAQVVNWQGRHREAKELYSALLEDHPGNGDAVVGLAQAEIWLGRSDRARSLLEGLEGSSEATGLLDEIDRATAPSLRFEYAISEDSDDLVMHRFEAGATYFIDDLTSVGISAGRLSMRQDGYPHITVKGISLALQRRFNEDLSLNVDLRPLMTEYFDPFTFDSWLTWTPNWRLRFDIGVYRQIVEVPLSVIRSITAAGGNLGVGIRLSDMFLLGGLLDIRSYSDGNGRVLWGANLSWLALKKPVEISFTPGYMGFAFSRLEDNGYYSPEEYHNIGVAATVKYRVKRKYALTLEGRVSQEKESGGDFFTVGYVRAAAEHDVHERVTWGAEFFTSNSSLAGEAGYGRTLGQIFLVIRL